MRTPPALAGADGSRQSDADPSRPAAASQHVATPRAESRGNAGVSADAAEPEVRVLAIRPHRSTKPTSVRAFVDVRIGDLLRIKGISIIVRDGEPPWLGMPSSKTNHGWLNVIELGPDLRRRMTEVVLEVWQGGR
jgi:DNA-binding cell septation regulator SpoVG